MEALLQNIWAVGGVLSIGWIMFIFQFFADRKDAKERELRNDARAREEMARVERWATIIEGLSNKLDPRR